MGMDPSLNISSSWNQEVKPQGLAYWSELSMVDSAWKHGILTCPEGYDKIIIYPGTS